MFHTKTTCPPGRTIRSNSALAAATSTQCHVWAHTTASTLSSASAVASAVARHTGTSNIPDSVRTMSAEGSAAKTSRPGRSRSRVSFPVPAPTSSTVWAAVTSSATSRW